MTTVDDLNEIARLGLQQPREDFELRPFQLLAYAFGKRRRRFILSLDKGLGKTIVDYTIVEDIGGGRIVVLCTTNAFTTWEEQASRWNTTYSGKVQIVSGSSGLRYTQWRNNQALVYVTTPNAFLQDSKDGSLPDWVKAPGWTLIIDEFQRYLRRHGTRKKPNKFFALLKSLPFTNFIPTSGSAVSKGPQDIWPILHLADPKRFPSYFAYIRRWCELYDDGFGVVIGGPHPDPEVVKEWRRVVGSWIFHRTKEMVADQLPSKVRMMHDVQMEPWQQRLHDELNEQLWTEAPSGDFIFAKNALARIYKLRLALVCPKALHPSYGHGAGIESIVDTCQHEGIDRFVINTPFRKPIPYLREYLEAQGYKVWVLWGGIKKEERDRAIAEWSAGKGVILQVIKYAQSYELVASPYCFMLGYEWDPEDNKQAEDRQHRLSSTDTVFCYYIRHVGAYDEDVLRINVEKSVNVNILWGRYGTAAFKHKSQGTSAAEEAFTIDLDSVTEQDFDKAEIAASWEDLDDPTPVSEGT